MLDASSSLSTHHFATQIEICIIENCKIWCSQFFLMLFQLLRPTVYFLRYIYGISDGSSKAANVVGDVERNLNSKSDKLIYSEEGESKPHSHTHTDSARRRMMCFLFVVVRGYSVSCQLISEKLLLLLLLMMHMCESKLGTYQSAVQFPESCTQEDKHVRFNLIRPHRRHHRLPFRVLNNVRTFIVVTIQPKAIARPVRGICMTIGVGGPTSIGTYVSTLIRNDADMYTSASLMFDRFHASVGIKF